jgi:DNA-binding NarL/FixJ family response regulator
MKVLIVDDDAAIRDILLELLHGEGFRVQGASDGGAALQMLAQEDGWVVFLDWMMPGVDGRGVLAAVGQPVYSDVSHETLASGGCSVGPRRVRRRLAQALRPRGGAGPPAPPWSCGSPNTCPCLKSSAARLVINACTALS